MHTTTLNACPGAAAADYPDSGGLYERVGGEAGIVRLVSRFYALMDALPEGYAARRLHPESLQSSAHKLVQFLSGWLGGPPLYVQNHGHPRLRMRHLPYAIGRQERDAWMHCMTLALHDTVDDALVRDALQDAMAALADHMINTGQDAESCY